MASNMTLEGETELILTSPNKRDLSGTNNTNGIFYNPSSSPNKLSEDWMKYILPTTLITNLSIPGTHESCALFGGLTGSAKC